ncbi:hypothetical protein ACIPUP_07515 [Pectobacterium actinidiae]|uniref:Uncharacterized protein n=1 Tax=Pectobacterium actinidiae TaxID=1507808 RepID=A0ABW8G8J6_9GAMM
MTRTEHIQEMLTIADRINEIIAEMQARKEALLAEQMPKAA